MTTKMRDRPVEIDTRSQLNMLNCPICHGDNLHQGRVTVYERNEDAEQVLRTIVADRGHLSRDFVANSSSGNPSARRHGLAIQFECEGCGDIGELTIEQHKGSTYLAWR